MMIAEILKYLILAFVCGLLLLTLAGEMFGHANVRRFLFWVRGRSEVTGEPVRRFPLF